MAGISHRIVAGAKFQLWASSAQSLRVSGSPKEEGAVTELGLSGLGKDGHRRSVSEGRKWLA